MEYTQMTLDEWVGIKRKLQQELLGIKRGFVRIGYILRRIEEQALYEQDGYKSVAEFAQEEYGLNRSTTSRLISINREYSVGGYSEELRPEYEGMGQSQLEEMLGLGEGDRAMVGPGTPREDIRELKRFNKEAPEAGAAGSLVQLVSQFYKDNPGILKAVYRGMPFGGQDGKRFAETANPAGNRSYRKGLYFLMMYEDRVCVKKFGEEPRNMSWMQFYGLTVEAVGEAPPEAQGGEESPGIPEETGAETVKEAGEEVKPEPEEAEPGETEPAREDPAAGTGEAEEAGGEQDGSSGEKGSREEQDGGSGEEDSSGEQNVGVQGDGSEEQDNATQKNSGDGQDAPCKKDGSGEQDEPGEKEPEKIIAPAQKCQEIQVQEAALEPETAGKQFETRFETRKEYMDKLTAEEAAGYIRDEYDRHSLQASYLAYQFRLTEWLLEKVDWQGITIKGKQGGDSDAK